MEKPEYPWGCPKPFDYFLKYKHNFKKPTLPEDRSECGGTDYNHNYANDYDITGCEESISEVVFADRQKHWDDESPYYCNECEDEGCEECEQERLSTKSLNGMSLQDLIDMLPDGVNPSDTLISFDLDDWAGTLFANFSLSYEKKLDPKRQLAKYEKALSEYNKKFDEYIKKKIAYDKWEKEQKISELKEKLKELESE